MADLDQTEAHDADQTRVLSDVSIESIGERGAYLDKEICRLLQDLDVESR